MYWLAIYPIDQVKSAIMTDSIVKSERKYPSMASAFQVNWILSSDLAVFSNLSLAEHILSVCKGC